VHVGGALDVSPLAVAMAPLGVASTMQNALRLSPVSSTGVILA
jgi:hypothetical protein